MLEVGFSKPKKFRLFSWLTRIYQNTNFSHVYLNFNNNQIFEASYGDLHFIKVEDWEKRNKVIDSFPIKVKVKTFNALKQWCIEHEGLDYSEFQVLGILISDLFKLNRNPFSRGKSAQICSEVVDRALNVPLDKSEDLVTPKDLYTYFKSQEKK